MPCNKKQWNKKHSFHMDSFNIRRRKKKCLHAAGISTSPCLASGRQCNALLYPKINSCSIEFFCVLFDFIHVRDCFFISKKLCIALLDWVPYFQKDTTPAFLQIAPKVYMSNLHLVMTD